MYEQAPGMFPFAAVYGDLPLPIDPWRLHPCGLRSRVPRGRNGTEFLGVGSVAAFEDAVFQGCFEGRGVVIELQNQLVVFKTSARRDNALTAIEEPSLVAGNL